MSTDESLATDARTANYAERIATAHGLSGFTTTPEGDLVYATYRDGSYDLSVAGTRLTDVEGDLTAPTWLEGRGSVLVRRDRNGTENFDLLEVDPETGDTTPALDDRFLNFKARQHPTDPGRIAFVSNRDRSLDLYTLDLEGGEVTRRSETDAPVMGYDWSPDGERLVYQAGTFEDTSLRAVFLKLNRDEVLVDEPDSEQSIAFTDSGRGAWSEEGIVFTTNHHTGFRELAVAEPDGEFELHYVNNRDKYDPKWTEDGAIAYLEARGGDRSLCRLEDGSVTTVEEKGMNSTVKTIDGALHYEFECPVTAGELRREGETVVEAGRVAVPTVAPDEITYESFDGQEIAARRYTPKGDPLGAVVKPHGGPEAQHWNGLGVLTQALVHAGFEVLAPDFRGSLGYGREFRKASDADLGGDDLSDVVAGAEYLREQGHDHVGILGTSYGGYLSLMGVGATDAFDAGVSVCAVVNWETTVENAREYLGAVVHRKLGGTPDERPELYEDRSPITYADEMDVPLLVVQGANDPRVPESEAEQLTASLTERGIDHDYLRFEDEGHGVVRTENRVEYVTRSVEFFTSHLDADSNGGESHR